MRASSLDGLPELFNVLRDERAWWAWTHCWCSNWCAILPNSAASHSDQVRSYKEHCSSKGLRCGLTAVSKKIKYIAKQQVENAFLMTNMSLAHSNEPYSPVESAYITGKGCGEFVVGGK